MSLEMKTCSKPKKNTPKKKKTPTKITITRVDADIATQNGFFDEGCYGSSCKDECCGWGCDMDLTTLKLVQKHRKLVEPLIGAKIEEGFSSPLKIDDDYIGGADREAAGGKKKRKVVEPLMGAKIEECFSTPLKIDDDYIGGAYRETAVRKKDGLCAFHLKGQKGCSLFYLWITEKLPKKIVPTICRTYPITWHRGRLFIDKPLKKNCKAKEKTPKGTKVPSLFETQKKEVRALFDIPAKELKKLIGK